MSAGWSGGDGLSVLLVLDVSLAIVLSGISCSGSGWNILHLLKCCELLEEKLDITCNKLLHTAQCNRYLWLKCIVIHSEAFLGKCCTM